MAGRSPRYPSSNLEDAISRAEKIRSADRTNVITREVAAKHMGYTSLSGASDKAIASLVHYGLLERVSKGELRISDLAIDILVPEDDERRAAALREAAFSPKIFEEIKRRYPDDHFSEESLRSFLIREGYLDSATPQVIDMYRQNLSYLRLNEADERGGNGRIRGSESEDQGVPKRRFGGASVGDFIQWESGGELKFQTPRRVTHVHESGEWVFVEGTNTGIPMSQVILEQPPIQAPPLGTPPTLNIEPPREMAGPTEKEWVRTPLGKGAFARIMVTEDLSDAQIDKLTAILTAMKEG